MFKRLIHTLYLAGFTSLPLALGWVICVCAAPAHSDCCAKDQQATEPCACCTAPQGCQDQIGSCASCAVSAPAQPFTQPDQQTAAAKLPAQPQVARVTVEAGSLRLRTALPGLSASPYILAGKVLSYHARWNT